MASYNQILTKKMLWNRFSNDSNSLGENQGLAITQSERSPNGTDSGLNPHSFGKGTNNSVTTIDNSEKVSDKGTLHKTFFYKDSKGKRIPYKNKPSILKNGLWTVVPQSVLLKNSSRQTPKIFLLLTNLLMAKLQIILKFLFFIL